MAINLSDLPPKYQAQAIEKYNQQQGHSRPVPEPSESVGGKVSKYRNTRAMRTTRGGAVLHFDSQKEARRFDYLSGLEAHGKIRDLRLQVDFTLQEAYTDTTGRRVRAIRYRADFTYLKPQDAGGAYWADSGAPWVLVVEDVKSRATVTRTYAMKKKMLKDRYGLEINEV